MSKLLVISAQKVLVAAMIAGKMFQINKQENKIFPVQGRTGTKTADSISSLRDCVAKYVIFNNT